MRPASSECGGWNGAQGRNRTTDTAIFSRMLYQLSYLGRSRGRGKSPSSPRVIGGRGGAVYRCDKIVSTFLLDWRWHSRHIWCDDKILKNMRYSASSSSPSMAGMT